MKKLSSIGKLNLVAGISFLLIGILAVFNEHLPGSFFAEMEPLVFIPLGISLLLSASFFKKPVGN
ncbi:hypothetical protein SFC65_20165 [Priestia filamentosa]|uniref:hypothetical protein n=1 Tax=Priestia filamentosa TaxID=1402861 RepID=UPI003982A590